MGNAPGTVIRAAIYCRLSRKGGRSVERQEQDGRAIATDRGWRVARVFAETVSASEFAKKAREQWELLLAAVRAKEFDAVIVWLEDRSNRDVVKAAEFAQACREAGVRLVIADNEVEYDFTDPEHTAKFYGEVVAAQREVARLSKRVRRARLQAAAEGQRHPGGRRAFGERGIGPKGNGRHAVSAAQVEREREAIREAARRILAGDTLRGICFEWNGEPGPDGKPTKPPRVRPASGEHWSTQPLRRMLLQPRMTGLRDHRGTLYPSTEIEPVLDRETWEAVRAILTDPTRMVSAVGGVPRYLLTGLAICGKCGAKLRAERDRRGEVVYRCPSRSGGGRRCVMRKAAPVEDMILRAVFKAVEEGQEWDRQAAQRPTDDPARPHYEALARITAELDVLDRRIGEAELAEELGGKPHPSAATLRGMLADREAEQERHQQAVSRLQHGRVAAAVPRNLRRVWPSLSLDRQRAILAALIERVDIRPQGGSRVFDPAAIKVTRRGR